MQLKSIVNKLTKPPEKLFIIDGLGALISAFLLGVVLVKFESTFGIPKEALYFLAIWPVIFSIYDAICFFKAKPKVSFYLRVIATLNLLYCCLSLTIAFYHLDKLTLLGWIYILAEILIVVLLAAVEFKVAGRVGGK